MREGHEEGYIDSHVHLYTADDLKKVNTNGLPYVLPAPHSLHGYLQHCEEQLGSLPTLINNVYLSILPDSENIIHSFEQMDALKKANPQKYGNIQLVGTVKAIPGPVTAELIKHPQVKGIRFSLHDLSPEKVGEAQYKSKAWQETFLALRSDQHVHIYAKQPATILKILKQIPASVTIVADHIGICDPEKGPDDQHFQALLSEAARRKNVYFKGPGYRTKINPMEVVPYVEAIIRKIGADKIILQATDAPFVGKNTQGVTFKDAFDLKKIHAFTHQLAAEIVRRNQGPEPLTTHQLLNQNLERLLHMETQKHYTQENVTIPVTYPGDKNASLFKATVFKPANPTKEQQHRTPILFNSGFTGGVSMYGQLMGKALSKLGYTVVTYDVAGYYSNKKLRNSKTHNGQEVTRVSLKDQQQELVDALKWVGKTYGKTPALISWAMGSTASLGAITELAAGKSADQVPVFVPLQYTNMKNLQGLRGKNANAHDVELRKLAKADTWSPTPVFDLTNNKQPGFYPLDPGTDTYTQKQLTGYTITNGAEERWPGSQSISAGSYVEAVEYNPEKTLSKANKKNLPYLLPIHGANNPLHAPSETKRLASKYPGNKHQALFIAGMGHGGEMEEKNPVFKRVIDHIDRTLRKELNIPAPEKASARSVA